MGQKLKVLESKVPSSNSSTLNSIINLNDFELINFKMLGKIFYKIEGWYPLLGLPLISSLYLRDFSFFPVAFILSLLLLSLAHALDDGKPTSIIYFLLALFISLLTDTIQLTLVIFVLIILYKFFKRTPLSAFYVGFSYPTLLFFQFRPSLGFFFLYLLFSILITISEFYHEAHHYEQDLREGRKTTAIYFGFKVDEAQRKEVRRCLIAVTVAVIVFILASG